jgi:threonine/homoserine/homoserine lactone efflux protein
MSQLIVSLIVPALAIALNPVPIIAVVTLLSTDHGRRNAFAFVVSLLVVMLTVAGLTIFVLGSTSSQSSASTGQAAAQTLFGVVFLVLFAAQWRAKPSATDETPGWMRLIDKAGLVAAVVLALALTNYALLSAGAGIIRKAGVGTSQEAQALAFFVVLAVSTVIAPLVAYLLRPVWAREQLGRLKVWLTRHNRVILMIVFGLMGALFTAQGVVNLLH